MTTVDVTKILTYFTMTKRETSSTLLVPLASLFFVGTLLFPSFSLAQTSTSTLDNASTSPLVAEVPVQADWYTSDWIGGEDIDRGDFVVGPGKVEVEIKPGETVVRYLSITNRISDKRSFKLLVEDIAGGTDGRSVQLLGEERGPYTLRDYISFPETTFTLGLGERAKIPVTITIPPDAEPGGHYGSVLVTTVQESATEGSDTMQGMRSPIIARIGALFFVTVPGDIERAGETKNVTLIGKPWWIEKGPITLGITFENTGSLHLNPYGELRVTNMFGEEVGNMEIDPWFVLPKSLRTREITWDREFLLGRYKAEVLINRGYEDIVDTKQVVFWVLPWKIIGGIFIVIFIIFFTLRTFFRMFEFKRKGN